MRKLFLFTMAVLFTAFCFAQNVDSTLGSTIGKPLISAADAKWAWFAGIMTVIVLLDHLFASIPSINGNSTFQVITRFLTGATTNT